MILSQISETEDELEEKFEDKETILKYDCSKKQFTFGWKAKLKQK